MKRLVELKKPTKLADPTTSYEILAGDCDFVGGDLVFPSAYGDVTIPQECIGPFVNLDDGTDLVTFGQSRPDVLVINNG